ncbi:MAG: rhomboid family intramembrane serine protease [Acidobacteria bacterium]|nr:rhomboid family intramembrane serine protease [Acidobacteriota bacterium]
MGYGYQTQIRFGPRLTPMVKILLFANIGVFILLTIDRTLTPINQLGYIDGWLALIPVKVTQDFQIWRLVTYMFLHGKGIFHILFNMFILWMFGPEVEQVLGPNRFLRYYFFTGIGAGLCSLLTNPFDFILVVGASGAIYGILLAFALYFPNRTLLLFFVIPVKAKYLVVGLVIFELLLSIQGPRDGIAHLAHVGGAAFGYLFLKRKTMLPDLKYGYLRLKGWWYRRKFKVYQGKKDDDRWTH